MPVTTDPRALIAHGQHVDDLWRSGRCSATDVTYCESWAIANLSALLTGYASALDEVERVTAALEKEESDCLELISERDHREQQINEIADALGDESEWSNLSDRGVNARELAEAIVQQLVAARAAIGEQALVIEQQDRNLERMRQANASLIPGAMLTATEIECLRVERDGARTDLATLRTSLAALRHEIACGRHHNLLAKIDAIIGAPCPTTKRLSGRSPVE